MVVDGQFKLQQGSKVAVTNHPGGDDHKPGDPSRKDGDQPQHQHGKLGSRDGKTDGSPSPAATPAVVTRR